MGLVVDAVVGFAVAAGFGVAVADGLEVGLAVGAAVGFTVGFGVAVAEGFAVALLPEEGLLAVLLPELGFVVADGFAVALGFDAVLPEEFEDDGLLAVLFSVLDEADELLPFELSVLLLSVFAPGVAVGFALAVLALAVGLLLVVDALLPCSFSDTELLTALDVSVALFSEPFPFAQAVTLTANNAQRIIVVILFSILNNASFLYYNICSGSNDRMLRLSRLLPTFLSYIERSCFEAYRSSFALIPIQVTAQIKCRIMSLECHHHRCDICLQLFQFCFHTYRFPMFPEA